MTLASSPAPRSTRQRPSALLASLNTIARMPARETQPRVFAVRSRTLAKVDSIGFVVRMCIQCSAGNLMGVVVSKLDAIRLAKITGDIAQNVNFAINVNVLRAFLDANSVDYNSASSDKPLPPTAIAEKAKGFTVLVECWK